MADFTRCSVFHRNRRCVLELHTGDHQFEETKPMELVAIGRKDDQGKPRMALLPPKALREVAQVLTHGATKYGDHNWREVIAAEGGRERYLDAAMRHLTDYLDGEVNDESSRHHLAHAVCSLLFIVEVDLP